MFSSRAELYVRIIPKYSIVPDQARIRDEIAKKNIIIFIIHYSMYTTVENVDTTPHHTLHYTPGKQLLDASDLLGRFL